jgi:hypothetical protein
LDRPLNEYSPWDNEIHPKAAGFKAIAQDAWAPVLGGLLK